MDVDQEMFSATSSFAFSPLFLLFPSFLPLLFSLFSSLLLLPALLLALLLFPSRVLFLHLFRGTFTLNVFHSFAQTLGLKEKISTKLFLVFIRQSSFFSFYSGKHHWISIKCLFGYRGKKSARCSVRCKWKSERGCCTSSGQSPEDSWLSTTRPGFDSRCRNQGCSKHKCTNVSTIQQVLRITWLRSCYEWMRDGRWISK